MPTKKLKYFEEADTLNLEEYYETQITLNQKEIELDINFDSKTISEQTIEKINRFLDSLGTIHDKNMQLIRDDFADGDTVEEYMKLHLDLLANAEFKNRIGGEFRKLDPKEQLLSLVYLKRIGLYPEDEGYFAVFDYTIGEDVTNHLIVLFMKEDGEMDFMAIES